MLIYNILWSVVGKKDNGSGLRVKGSWLLLVHGERFMVNGYFLLIWEKRRNEKTTANVYKSRSFFVKMRARSEEIVVAELKKSNN